MKFNSIVNALGSILVLVALSIGCSTPAEESAAAPAEDGAAAMKTANDSPMTGGEDTIAIAGSTIPSTQHTFNVARTSDLKIDPSSEFEIEQRLWQDHEYLFSTYATLTGFTPDDRSVELLKSNGVNIKVEIAILCAEDQQYLSSIPEYERSRLDAN